MKEQKIEKITKHLLAKLEGKIIRDIERVELREVELDQRNIDVYDSSRVGELVVRIKYY